jgi:hypothetical protein
MVKLAAQSVALSPGGNFQCNPTRSRQHFVAVSQRLVGYRMVDRKAKRAQKARVGLPFGGEGGIRTLGTG